MTNVKYPAFLPLVGEKFYLTASQWEAFWRLTDGPTPLNEHIRRIVDFLESQDILTRH